jgi:hypothetical protein
VPKVMHKRILSRKLYIGEKYAKECYATLFAVQRLLGRSVTIKILFSFMDLREVRSTDWANDMQEYAMYF